MKKHIVISDVKCPHCTTQMYTEQQEDEARTMTVKCTDETCVGFNKPFEVPMVELKPYVKPAPKK